MAHRKHRTPVPVATGHQQPQPTTIGGQLQPGTVGGSTIVLFNEDQSVIVTAQLRDPITAPLPKPRYDTVDRPGLVGAVHWRGRDPYEMTVPLRFDAFPDGNVEPQCRALDRLALRDGGAEPDKIGLIGPVPTAPGMGDPPLWRIIDMTEAETTLFNTAGRRCRFAVDVMLREAADPSALTISTGKGVHTKRREIHQGESLYHFAKRVTGKRSNAPAIAKANQIKVSFVAKLALKLRIP